MTHPQPGTRVRIAPNAPAQYRCKTGRIGTVREAADGLLRVECEGRVLVLLPAEVEVIEQQETHHAR